MWSDNETDRDFLNFRCVADTAAEMIIQADGRPLSMGVSGGWGVGKSSMLKFISTALHERGDDKYLFVEFNAWLYQGYDDARAALMEVIAEKLVEHCEKKGTALQKAKSLLGRVNWLRAAGLVAGSALAMSLGLPPIGLPGAVKSLWDGWRDGDVSGDDVKAADEVGGRVAEAGGKLVKPIESPPRQIHELRRQFEETLEEMGVTLVVFIDDLDRCLPATTISTLEAIRLFLFLPRTAFIIAADDRMIRQAVRVHFQGVDLDDDLVTNYFDKLVQVPLRVPPLGTQEVRAYLMLLFIENSKLEAGRKEVLRGAVCRQLAGSWKGMRTDHQFVSSLMDDCTDDLRANLALADRLAPLMTSAKQIAGNPRLIKRFLNTLAIRLSIARSQDVLVDEAALAKMLLFERCGDRKAHLELLAAINDGVDGKPAFLRKWEELAQAGEDLKDLPQPWNDDFVRDWLALPPSLADSDLRGAVYVSREHLPVITAADQLSSEAAQLLEALLALDQRASEALAVRLKSLSGRELAMIAERLLVRARQVPKWGTPPVLWAYMTLIQADADLAGDLSRFLEALPGARLEPDIVPALGDHEWARRALEKWRVDKDAPDTVRRAVTAFLKAGT
jgi:predicted KAP-like P-loop ATPase